MKKGNFGYIKSARKRSVVRTAIYFSISLLLFITGYISTGTRMNLLTVAAVLGCLPASKSAVNMIMLFKAGLCSQECFEKIQPVTAGTFVLYDLYLTAYQKNYQISVMAIKGNALCCYTEDEKCEISSGEKHIETVLEQGGYKGYTVKIFTGFDKFYERLVQLQKLDEKKEEKYKAIAEIIKDVSL